SAARRLAALENGPEPMGMLEGFAVPAAATHEWEGMVALYRQLHSGDSDWPGEFDSLLDWYQPQLERIYDDAPLRAADLAQLRRIAATYASPERFLTELTLDPPAATRNN